MALAPCDYGPDGCCNRCSGDSFSSGSGYCEANPKKVLDRCTGFVPNPKYDAEQEKRETAAMLPNEPLCDLSAVKL